MISSKVICEFPFSLEISESFRIAARASAAVGAVFSFTAKGLEVSQKKGIVEIEKEGSISKFVDRVKSISFSARRAIANGQKVLYVTERCVFRLTPKGLKLIEVYPGIDVQKDILDLLPFEVEV